MYDYTLGIDISKNKFDTALLIDDKYNTKVFNNTVKGFEEFYAWIQKYIENLSDLHICMEATGIYGDNLATFLFDKSINISVVNPARVKGFGHSELSRNKTDQADAKLISRFCKAMKPGLWRPIETHIQELRGWVKRLDSLNTMKQQETNRLESAKGEVYTAIMVHIAFLDEQIKKAKAVIETLISKNNKLKQKKSF